MCILLFESNNNTLTDNTVNLNNGGIGLDYSRNNILRNNTALSNNFSISLVRYSNNNIISDNNISDNVHYGIWLNSSNSNLIYNNYFNNTNNAWDNGNNTWNISKTAGTNIIGGPYIGGNFWANPNGTGFSQNCMDDDSDGICDESYALNNNSVDYLPLTPPIITNFSVVPNMSINATNPAMLSADVSDANLRAVTFGIVDSSNLTAPDQTVIAVIINSTGISGRYTINPPGPWRGIAANITNGTAYEYPATIFTVQTEPQFVLVDGYFMKNATQDWQPAFLIFNNTTFNLEFVSNETEILEIESGNSSFKISNLKYKSGLTQQPEKIDGTTFTLWSIGDDRNPRMESRSVPTGNYKAMVHAVDTAENEYILWADMGVVALPPSPTTTYSPSGSSSSGSSGGGGGGGASGENYANIEIKEKYDLHIFKDKVTSYKFANKSNPILFVNITGNTSAGDVTAAVEVLRDTSSLVKSPPQGIVYRNINIWVGTSGFAVPKNIKEAIIRFRVENSWLNNSKLAGSDIKMVRWDGNGWITLETTEKSKDSTYTYYEAKTDSFSSFAIAGFRDSITTAAPAEANITKSTVQAEAIDPAQTEDQTKKAAGFDIVLAIITLLAVYIPRQRRR